MIGHLHGTVIEKQESELLVSVMGVGYKVFCPTALALSISSGDDISIFTYLAVRETALDLYGFGTKQELEFFKLLITISGIGPKVGLSILNAALPETLYIAIKQKDTSVLTKVSGIGKKNAEKIILELQNKVDRFANSFNSTANANQDIEVFEALEALGFDPKSIQEVLKNKKLQNLETSAKIKESIKLLGNK